MRESSAAGSMGGCALKRISSVVIDYLTSC